MVPQSRSRPVSANTTNSNASGTSSYFTDRSGIPGLDGVPTSEERPLPDLLNLLVDAAHRSHESRKLLHPQTTAYSLFAWRVAGANQKPTSVSSAATTTTANNNRAGALSRITSCGPVHSSTAIFAWGETAPKAQPHNPTASQAAPSTQANPGPSPSAARGDASAATSPQPQQNRSPCLTAAPPKASAHAHVPESSSAIVTLSSSGSGLFASEPSGLSTAVRTASNTVAGRTLAGASRLSGRGDAAAAAIGGARVVEGVDDDGGDGTGSGDPGSGAGGCRAEGSVARSPREIVRPAVVARALSVWADSELEVVCLYDSNFQTANQRGQHGVPLRVPARSHIGPISYLYRWYCKRATQFRRAPSAADLFDAPAMPPQAPSSGGPIRSGSSGSSCSHMQGWSINGYSAPSGPVPCVASKPAVTVARDSEGSSVRSLSAGSSAGCSSGSGAGGGTFPWPRPATFVAATIKGDPRAAGSMSGSQQRAAAITTVAGVARPPSGKTPPEASGGTRAGASGGAAVNSAGAASSGRRLNLSLDPVINEAEVVDLLEDLEIVPQLASRLDIKHLFNAALRANEPSAVGRASGATTSHHHNHRHNQTALSAQTSFASDVKSRQDAAVAAGSGPAASRHPDGAGSAVGSDGGTGPGPTKARPCSAPRSGVRGVGSYDSGNSGGVSSAAIPRPQVHPDEIRFPVFKDLLIRLAIAIACNEAPYTSTIMAAAAGSTGPRVGVARPTVKNPEAAGRQPSRRSSSGSAANITAAAASSSGIGTGVSYCWGRSVSCDEAVTAVRQLLERMGIFRRDLRGLKHRLDELSRFAKEHSERALANKRRYVAVPSPVAAAQDVTVAAALSPPVAATSVATARLARGNPPQTWSVMAPAPAPQYLIAVLAEEDQGDDEAYHPAWREFASTALELGVLRPGELRQCRLMLHSRGPYALNVYIDATAAPFCRCSHIGLHSVPPGMPLRVDVLVQLEALGEAVGELVLQYSSSQDRREKAIVVPVYGMVCPPTSDPMAGRMKPIVLSERSGLAPKSVLQAVAPAVAIGALAAGPLGHKTASSKGGAPAAVQPPPPPAVQTSYSTGLRYAWSSPTAVQSAADENSKATTLEPVVQPDVGCRCRGAGHDGARVNGNGDGDGDGSLLCGGGAGVAVPDEDSSSTGRSLGGVGGGAYVPDPTAAPAVLYDEVDPAGLEMEAPEHGIAAVRVRDGSGEGPSAIVGDSGAWERSEGPDEGFLGAMGSGGALGNSRRDGSSSYRVAEEGAA